MLFSLSSAIEERKATVGTLCSGTCDSDLLYCSPEGVCLCDEDNANFVYEYRHHFTIREPKCEILPCTLAKPEEKNECNLRHAKCMPHREGNETTGYCKCPGTMLGARRGTAFTLSHCKDAVMSNVGEKCISNLYLCNIAKKLKCRDGMCECYDGHIFSFEEDICITEKEYHRKYGYDKLGTFGKYCSNTIDCNSGMFCKNKRCDCPNFCRSGEYIRTEEVCYCAFDMTKLAYIIPSIVISILFLLFFIGLCYFNKKYEESLQAQSNLVLVHGRKTPVSSVPHYLHSSQAPFITPLSPSTNSLAPMRGGGVGGGSPQSERYRQRAEEEQDWRNEEPPQQLSGVELSAQANNGNGGGGGGNAGGTYSFYPPPPYQLNEMVAAEMVEAQMRQDSPSTVQYMEPN